jgi:hypothetical protein
MAYERITCEDIAAKFPRDDGSVGCSKAYVSDVFNGNKTPPDAESRFMTAINAIRAERGRQ